MIEYFRLFYLVLSGGLLIWAFTSYLQSRKLPPLPPGPPADPIIGHLRIMPTEHHGVAFHELSKYGTLPFTSSSVYNLIYVQEKSLIFAPWAER